MRTIDRLYKVTTKRIAKSGLRATNYFGNNKQFISETNNIQRQSVCILQRIARYICATQRTEYAKLRHNTVVYLDALYLVAVYSDAYERILTHCGVYSTCITSRFVNS